jgi:hypothetical protein
MLRLARRRQAKDVREQNLFLEQQPARDQRRDDELETELHAAGTESLLRELDHVGDLSARGLRRAYHVEEGCDLGRRIFRLGGDAQMRDLSVAENAGRFDFLDVQHAGRKQQQQRRLDGTVTLHEVRRQQHGGFRRTERRGRFGHRTCHPPRSGAL